MQVMAASTYRRPTKEDKMKLDSRKKIVALVAISGISIVVNITTLASNTKLKEEARDYATQVENLKEKRDNTTRNKVATELKIEAQKSIDEDEIKGLAESFLKSYYSYTYLTKESIYENIKPYSTAYLQKKVRPKTSEEYNSDVDFTSTLDDIKLYYTSYEDKSKASIMAISKHSIKVEGKGEATPLITQLDVIYTSDGWRVNDIVFSETFKNFEKY